MYFSEARRAAEAEGYTELEKDRRVADGVYPFSLEPEEHMGFHWLSIVDADGMQVAVMSPPDGAMLPDKERAAQLPRDLRRRRGGGRGV